MPPSEPESTAQHRETWFKGVAGRALIAVILVGSLVTGGWLVAKTTSSPDQNTTPGIGSFTETAASGPSILEISAPIQATTPQQGSSDLDSWAANLGKVLDIPARALAGYATAELVLRTEQPRCQLSWVTLAGIGKASSDHGRFGDGRFDPQGIAVPALKTLPLQGAAAEATTDEREGPLQLSPTQRGSAGLTSGSVQDIDDASLAAGRILCAQNTELAAGAGWWQALSRYRDSDFFRQQVLGNAQLYATVSLAPETATKPSTRAVRFALDQLGLPYIWGGNGPDEGAAGFDCSGLTKASYDNAGISLPRTADSQFRSLPPVANQQLPALGDLVFYGNPATRIHHVGLYLGNGLMINAPTQGQAVQIHTYHRSGDDYVGAGRPNG